MVYAKPPWKGPEHALKYLARYTHRVAIANSRLQSIDDGQVTFSYKDYRHQHRQRTLTLAATEFIRRFMMHVLPNGFVRIRYYGFLANTHRARATAQDPGTAGRSAASNPRRRIGRSAARPAGTYSRSALPSLQRRLAVAHRHRASTKAIGDPQPSLDGAYVTDDQSDVIPCQRFLTAHRDAALPVRLRLEKRRPLPPLSPSSSTQPAAFNLLTPTSQPASPTRRSSFSRPHTQAIRIARLRPTHSFRTAPSIGRVLTRCISQP